MPDLTHVVMKRAVNERVFLLSLHRMHENNLQEQIHQAIRILARMAGTSCIAEMCCFKLHSHWVVGWDVSSTEEYDGYMPATREDKELLEMLLFPEQDGKYIKLITLIIKKCLVGGLPAK
jgi:hypothetical protein